MSLSEYYYECNALWRQFDSLVDLHACTCETAPKVKKHSQLLRLMQFLMGLDDVFRSVRSLILTTEPLPDVKSTFATLCRDESTEIVSDVKTDHTKTAPQTLTSYQYQRLMTLHSDTDILISTLI
ncbi:hypothetical protein Tco_0131440 [Tanacetum coccineum]